jgi:hypothetical protein
MHSDINAKKRQGPDNAVMGYFVVEGCGFRIVSASHGAA